MNKNLMCPYCQRRSDLTKGVEVYPQRPDLAEKLFWRCEPCDAHVGVHEGTVMPLGPLAGKELRSWKRQAHKVFDPLWKGKMWRDDISESKARNAGYEWLAVRLEIESEDCHIGQFDIDTCKRAFEICKQYGPK